MKQLHRPDLWGWSRFDAARDLDFNSVLWVRDGGNVAVDPLPLTPHDAEHLDRLGGAALVVVTNSDHVRDAAAFAAHTGAEICGPRGEMGSFPLPCARWLGHDERVVPGLVTVALQGSKTPGELALKLGTDTLITGDMVRAPRGGHLALLPDAKLTNRMMAVMSLLELAKLDVEAVLVGDGWPVFRYGFAALRELLAAELERMPGGRGALGV